jgi:predicted lipoprotein with Yx(FWY)xxD motif
MRRLPLFLPALFFALALALTACGSDDKTKSSAEAAGSAGQRSGAPPTGPLTEPAAPPPTGTTIKLAASDYGEILFDGEDQAIYLFDTEDSTNPACYGPCAEAWPPVLTDGRPRAAGGVKQRLLGTTKRRDGSLQATYNGHPLYYYDEPPGVVSCQDVFEFGGTWLVVDGAGNAVS